MAFYASVRTQQTPEGIFLAQATAWSRWRHSATWCRAVARYRNLPASPPCSQRCDKVAFGAAVAGGRATEGVFLASKGSLKTIALSGNDAPGVSTGTFAEFDAPTINNWDEVAFRGHGASRTRDVAGALSLLGWQASQARDAGDRPPAAGRSTSSACPPSTTRA